MSWWMDIAVTLILNVLLYNGNCHQSMFFLPKIITCWQWPVNQRLMNSVYRPPLLQEKVRKLDQICPINGLLVPVLAWFLFLACTCTSGKLLQGYTVLVYTVCTCTCTSLNRQLFSPDWKNNNSHFHLLKMKISTIIWCLPVLHFCNLNFLNFFPQENFACTFGKRKKETTSCITY